MPTRFMARCVRLNVVWLTLICIPSAFAVHPPLIRSGCPGLHAPAACPVCGTAFDLRLRKLQLNADTGGRALPASPPGRTVTTDGQTMMLTLAPADLLPSHLLDLQGATIRFTPSGANYHVQSMSLAWDPVFGAEITGAPSQLWMLTQFQFPFSGMNWNALYLGMYGNITFGTDQEGFYDPTAHRFLLFRTFAGAMTNSVPVISPLFHKLGVFDPDSVCHRYAKELNDRLVVTWIMSEPYRDVFSFTGSPLINRFQAVLYSNGNIDFSYNQLSTQEGIAGVFPLPSGAEPTIATLSDPVDGSLPAYLDVTSVVAALVANHSIRFTFHFRGNPPPPGDPLLQDPIVFLVFADLDQPFFTTVDFDDADQQWGVQSGGDLQYHAFGPGISPNVQVSGSTLSFVVPIAQFGGLTQFAFFFDSVNFSLGSNNFDQGNPIAVTLPAIDSALMDLSATTGSEAVRQVIYEAFYHNDIPTEQALTPTIISAMGDRFDFITFYADFRLDRQETGAVSSGPIGNSVTGIPVSGYIPQDWGSTARLQCVMSTTYVHTPIASPSGVDLSGPYTQYDREVCLLSHELGHRWLSLQQAEVAGNLIAIGNSAPHWLDELHAPALVPHQLAQEASFMGGAYWQDNGNGTFTNLNQPFFQTGGYSPLDLYVMGLLDKADVPPFFLIQNLAFFNYDQDNRPVYSGTRLDVTVHDVTAVTGDRMPDFSNSQKRFNIGIVGIVANGAVPSTTLRTRIAGIRHAFTSFWGPSTDDVGRMTALVQADYNDDGYVDGGDLAVFTACGTGSAVSQSDPACRAEADFDRDGDVDEADFGYFQRLITGP